MRLEPNVMVLYVADLTIASRFYQDLLGIMPEEASATFHSFALSNGMHLALKARYSVVPPTQAKSGSGELAFTLDSDNRVDEVFAKWQANGINIICSPMQVPFGYTFVALDPDGHRLRVASLGKTTHK